MFETRQEKSALVLAIRDLTGEIKRHTDNKILKRIEEMETKIMSKVSEFVDAQTAFNARLDSAITGVQEDVKSLLQEIEDLKTNSGITPELLEKMEALTVHGEAITTKLEALDALHPPTPPTSPA